jgi:hypothetical protein
VIDIVTVDLDQEWKLRKPLFNTLNRLCGPFIEYFATPLTVNALSRGYFTEKSQDIHFSANVHSFTRIWSLPGIIGPDITLQQLKNAIIWCLMSLKLCPNNYFILIVKNSMARQQLLASKLNIMENLYVKHWCQILQQTQAGLIDTHLFIITETKHFSQDICDEITRNLQNRNIRLIWSESKNEKMDIKINKIIQENSDLLTPWKEIYEERGMDYKQFTDNLHIDTQKIEKKKFILLPTTFQLEFEHKVVAETFYTLRELNITAFTKIEDLITLCIKKTLRPHNIPSFLFLDTINETKWKFRHWTITICDKNANLQLPICPKQYYLDMKRTFIENPTMFQIIINKERDILNYENNLLKNYQTVHNKYWSHLGRINKSGELPTAYTSPKFSDIDKKLPLCRVRPIITYAKFSMKKTLSIVATALNFLLSMLDPTMHFDIMDTNLVKKNFEKLNANTPFGNFTGVISLLSDIESMFDRIEPGMVKETLEWLFIEVKN